MTTIQLGVPTVHCRSCQLNIEESLEDVAGVHAATVDLATKLVVVDYDIHSVDAATIAAAIEAAGYPVTGAMPGAPGGRTADAATPIDAARPSAGGARTRTT
jgi:copper chaperone CopZ